MNSKVVSDLTRVAAIEASQGELGWAQVYVLIGIYEELRNIREGLHGKS